MGKEHFDELAKNFAIEDFTRQTGLVDLSHIVVVNEAYENPKSGNLVSIAMVQ